MKRKIVVEVGWYKRIRVCGNKIVVPRIVDSTTIEYVSSTPFLSLVLVMLLFIATSSMLVVVGLPAIWLLPFSAMLIYIVDRRIREAKIAWMKQILPERKVLKIVKKYVELCTETGNEELSFSENDIIVIARCGYPVKCIEYSTSEVHRRSLTYTILLLIILLLYVLEWTHLLLIMIATSSILVIMLYARKPVCRKYLVRREQVEFKVKY